MGDSRPGLCFFLFLFASVFSLADHDYRLYGSRGAGGGGSAGRLMRGMTLREQVPWVVWDRCGAGMHPWIRAAMQGK